MTDNSDILPGKSLENINSKLHREAEKHKKDKFRCGDALADLLVVSKELEAENIMLRIRVKELEDEIEDMQQEQVYERWRLTRRQNEVL
jgi:hypothetical protein